MKVRSKKDVGPQAARQRASNPNPHIGCNTGICFIHVTLRLGGRRKPRLRESLGTQEVGVARRRRERLLASLQEQPGMELPARRVRAR